MSALLVGLGLAFTAAIGGAGWSRPRGGEGRRTASASAACLAALILLTADSASTWGYPPWLFPMIGLLIAGGGWILRLRSGNGLQRVVRWPDPRALLTPGVVGLSLAVPLLILPVPLDTDAQGFGYLSLMIRDGGTITSLAPWHPEVSYLYSPGALLLFASLSRLLPRVPMSSVMMGASHAAAFLFIWLAGEFGHELGLQAAFADRPGGAPDASLKRWRRATGLSAGLSVGLWTGLLDSHYTAMFGLLFALGCLTSLLRYKRTHDWPEAVLSALFLAAVAATHPDMAIALGLGLAAFLVSSWLATDRPPLRIRLVMAGAIPGAAVAFLSPWLARIWPLLQSLRSPFATSDSHWRVLTLYHGVVWPGLALVGAVISLRRRPMWALGMAGWLALTVDVSTLGWLERLLPWLSRSVFRFDYPFSLGWHAPIIPYLALGAGALVWLADRLKLRWLDRWSTRVAVASVAALALLIVGSPQLLKVSKGRLRLQGAFATTNDVLAMRWLHDHAPLHARVLNYPGDYLGGRDWEGHWAPVLSERDSVYFRRQPFFLLPVGEPGGTDSIYREQIAFLAFWQDPADPAHSSALKAAGIQYVLVPEVIGDPASIHRSWRWAPPALLPGSESLPAQAPYLELVFQEGGAQVFQVVP